MADADGETDLLCCDRRCPDPFPCRLRAVGGEMVAKKEAERFVLDILIPVPGEMGR